MIAFDLGAAEFQAVVEPPPIIEPPVFVKALTDAAGHVWAMTALDPFGDLYLDGALLEVNSGRQMALSDGVVYIYGSEPAPVMWWRYDIPIKAWFSYPTLPTTTPIPPLPIPPTPTPGPTTIELSVGGVIKATGPIGTTVTYKAKKNETIAAVAK